MGEEELQQQEFSQEETQKSEEIVKEEQETNLVKHLRKQLEERIQREKELEKKLKETEDFLKIANVDEIIDKLKEVDRLKFEIQLQKKFPHLSEESEEILKEKRENETLEDAVARYIGKKQINNIQFSLGSSKIPPNLQETNIDNLPPEEREKKARELFKEIYGLE